LTGVVFVAMKIRQHWLYICVKTELCEECVVLAWLLQHRLLSLKLLMPC